MLTHPLRNPHVFLTISPICVLTQFVSITCLFTARKKIYTQAVRASGCPLATAARARPFHRPFHSAWPKGASPPSSLRDPCLAHPSPLDLDWEHRVPEQEM